MKLSLSLLLALLTLSASAISVSLLKNKHDSLTLQHEQLVLELKQTDPRIEADVKILREANEFEPELPALTEKALDNFNQAIEARRTRPFDPDTFAIRDLPELKSDRHAWLVHAPSDSRAFLEILASDDPRQGSFISQEYLSKLKKSRQQLIFSSAIPAGVSELVIHRTDAGYDDPLSLQVSLGDDQVFDTRDVPEKRNVDSLSPGNVRSRGPVDTELLYKQPLVFLPVDDGPIVAIGKTLRFRIVTQPAQLQPSQSNAR